MSRRHFAFALVLSAALAACTDSTAPARRGAPGVPGARGAVYVSSPLVDRLDIVVMEEAQGIPIRIQFALDEGKAEGGLVVPADEGPRHVLIRALDVYGEVTHEGKAQLPPVKEGENEPVRGVLEGGDGSIDVELDVRGVPRERGIVELRVEGKGEPRVGQPIDVVAVLRDPEGRPVEVAEGDFSWIVDDPRDGRFVPEAKDVPDPSVRLAKYLPARPGKYQVGILWRGEIWWRLIEVYADPYVAVAAGTSHSCAMRKSGAVFCWGSIAHGELANPASAQTYRPLAVPGSWNEVSAGGEYSCARSGGTISCWGRNDVGQLGNGAGGAGQTSFTPVAVQGVPGVSFTSISAGWRTACARGSDARGYCWGLGLGGASNATTPVQVATWRGIIAISAHADVACALTAESMYPALQAESRAADADTGTAQHAGAPMSLSGGNVLCWGSNWGGQLGTGAAGAGSPSPVAVNTSTYFTRLASGDASSACAITATGAAECWGDNYTSQLGTTNTPSQSNPTAVSGGLAFRGVSVSSFHACGVTLGDEAYCWGYNAYGKVGPGTGIGGTAASPLAVSSTQRFTDVSAGFDFSCGVATDGEVWCWGANYAGQLGVGYTSGHQSYFPTPVRVAAP